MFMVYADKQSSMMSYQKSNNVNWCVFIWRTIRPSFSL